MQDRDLETLVGYLDDELSAADRTALGRRLDREAKLAEAFAALAANDRLLRQAVGAAAAERDASALAPRIEALFAGSRLPPARRLAGPLLAATLAVALAAGLGLGFQASRLQEQDAAARLASDRAAEASAIQQAMDRALEGHISGQTVDLRNAATGRRVAVTPVRTFRSEAGHWCREFTQVVEDPAGRRATRGIACRQGKGDWRAMLWRPDESAG
jgi:surface antigen